MWFKIQIWPHDTTHWLSFVIGQDGHIYWRANDLARLMGYKSPNNFRRHSHFRTIKDVAPDFPSPYPKQILLTLDELSHLITFSYRGTLTLADRILKVWKEGRVHVTEREFNVNPHACTILQLHEQGILLPVFIEHAITRVLANYELLLNFKVAETKPTPNFTFPGFQEIMCDTLEEITTDSLEEIITENTEEIITGNTEGIMIDNIEGNNTEEITNDITEAVCETTAEGSKQKTTHCSIITFKIEWVTKKVFIYKHNHD